MFDTITATTNVEFDDRHNDDREQFSDTAAGHDALETWARRYDDLDGAPESDDDR